MLKGPTVQLLPHSLVTVEVVNEVEQRGLLTRCGQGEFGIKPSFFELDRATIK